MKKKIAILFFYICLTSCCHVYEGDDAGNSVCKWAVCGDDTIDGPCPTPK